MAIRQVRRVYALFEEHEILHSASAIAFQMLFAIVPLALFTLALVGFLDLDRVWEDAADELRPKVSQAAFTVMDDTARRILHRQQPFWLTAGAALAIWRLSAAMRATMGSLDRIYETDDDRSLVERLRTSIALSLATTVLVLAALAAVYLGPLVVDPEGALAIGTFVVRWTLALTLGVAAMALIVHFAPTMPQPLGWVSRGTMLAGACWLVATAAFAIYITKLANYGSVFGSFATIFLLLSYLYLSAAAFLLGVAIDVEARTSADREGHGHARGDLRAARLDRSALRRAAAS